LEVNRSFVLNKDCSQYKFELKGIVYFGQNHFTSHIITQGGQVWFHDGMTLGHSMRYEGLINSDLCPDLFHVANTTALLAIYTQI